MMCISLIVHRKHSLLVWINQISDEKIGLILRFLMEMTIQKARTEESVFFGLLMYTVWQCCMSNLHKARFSLL
ncbi:hypothetical protein HQ49_07505 [Porphyromonas gulae]|uniref:Transposase n=1 Tax=Porphyromonas gulae TaxID=111105 RepID=A0A099WP86_9PORP|nr:hypothetical protein HQ49_07505 [Porphyromonas gulae]KGN86010.1 hypothetical protein HR08_04910 [Porphyromonas gulae]